MRARLRRAFSLVEILVVLVIIGIMAAFLLPNYLGSGKKTDKKNPGSPIQRAHSVECQQYLSQVRQAYTMATTTDENKPQSIADLRPYGVTESISVCPVGKVPYRLDAATGRISCPQPGHESY